MKRLLLTLASLVALLSISYFCFLDKVKKIQEKIIDDVKKAYEIADINWIEPKLKGDGIYATRELIVEGVAPNKKEFEKADKISLLGYGITSVQKDIRLKEPNSNQATNIKADIKESIPLEIEKKLEKKVIDNNTHSTLKVSKDINGDISVKGVVSNLDIQNKIVSHAKYLSKNRVNSELAVGESTNKIDADLAILALDELSLLSEGNFTLTKESLNFNAKAKKESTKKRVFTEFKDQAPKDINIDLNISSPILKVAKAKKAKIESKLKKAVDKNITKTDKEIKKPKVANTANKCQQDINTFISKNHIHFKYNSDKIEKDSFATLERVVEILGKFPKKALIVSGHTDNTGNAAYNLKLSQKRADSVKRYLKKAGLTSAMIAVGYGEKRPIASNKTKESRAKNRRIEFKVVDKSVLTSIKENKKTHSYISQKECQKLIDRYINSKKIYFSMDKSKIEKKSIQVVKKLINIVKRCPDLKLLIKSYTDSIGTKEDNLKISQKKADTLKRYLVKNGLKKEMIEAVGYGESNPIADNTTASGRSKNRRVKFYVKEIK